MGRRSCCVPNCFRPSSILHRFPDPVHDEERFKLWVAFSGNEEIRTLEPHKIRAWRRICHLHFKECFVIENSRLRSDAFPSEHLPLLSIEEEDIDMGQEEEDDINMITEGDILPGSEVSPEQVFYGPSTSTFGQEEEQIIECKTPPQSNATPEAFYGPSTSKFGLEQSQQTSKLCSAKSSKASLLRTINVRKAGELTPKAKVMYKEAVNLKRQLSTAKFRHAACKKRLEYAAKCSKTEIFTQSSSSVMQNIVSRFFKSQLENVSKRPKGKRFSEDDKVLALALFKQSGPAYKFLSKLFSLPSRHTLTKYLNKIPMQPGINEYLFEVLASQVKSMKKKTGKYCILMFDEMSICPNFSYDQKKDIVQGFEDFGDRRTQNIANHVQVFMLRNIEAKWKQPIYYNFVNGATHHSEIERILKLLIEKLSEIGLIVCATVCDQGTNNSSAIKNLIADTKAGYLRRGEEMRGTFFEVADTVVVPLFDPPHLLKCIRNNLLTKDLKCSIDGVELIAKWDDIHKAYLIDPVFEEVRMMPKLTDYHVVPNMVKKMKVSSCTQVFSSSVSLAIHVMATTGTTHECDGRILKLKPEAKQTAKVIDFFDKLFDSVNGHVEVEVAGKKLRTCVTDKSAHIEFWKRAIKIFKTMKYVEKDDEDDTSDIDENEKPKKKEFTPPTIKNWITTLEGFIDIYTNMKVFGFKCMFPRTFNQDPLENFFGQIRQRGVRFTNPTVTAFTPFYKSLLVNNYSKGHSEGSNCENDDGDILVSLKRFVHQDVEVEVQPVLHSNEDFEIPEIFEDLKDLEATVLQGMSGSISKIVLPKVKDCESCKRNILSGEKGVEERKLKYCSSKFIDYLTNIYNIFNHIFPIICHLGNIMQRITIIIGENVKFPFTDDCGHNKDVENLVIQSFIRILILHNIKALNNIMLGKDRRNIDKADSIYKKAAEIFKKSRKR